MDVENSNEDLRKADRPSVLLYLADCGIRDGLTDEQQKQLDALRVAVAENFLTHTGVMVMEAKAALLDFYASLPFVKNGDNHMTPQQATENDAICLKKAATEYYPQYPHPRYGMRSL